MVTLDLGNGSPADEFLESLQRSNREGFDALELPGLEPQLIIATSGGGKGKQSSDIRNARELRQRCLEAKLLPDTHIEIREKTP